jgi:hypothetical protein
MAFTGFSPRMQTPGDLLAKLEHDLGRIKKDPHDAYAAFDFFVTADHFEEWLATVAGLKWQGHPAGQTDDQMRLVCHLGSGAKHQTATSTRHTAARDVVERAGAFDPGTFDSATFDVGGLLIDHTGIDGSLPGSIEVISLGERVVALLKAKHVTAGSP